MASRKRSIDQPELIAEEKADYKVTPEEQAIREEYQRQLAEALQDPDFRKIEGFPLGTEEAILALSDPPFYTACPNPFLEEIVEGWQIERAALRQELELPDDEPMGGKHRLKEGTPQKAYQREPFAADVSEGKNDPIYNAHSYHTKVPHKAIMRYILHYTDPGDIVLDGYCGTGMTGVAVQLCGEKKVVESLGYTVDKKGIIYDGEKIISLLGARKAVLNDLSPAATFIAYNYNTPVDSRKFKKEASRILAEVEKECGWMYETTHSDGKTKGRINYTVWSDVFRCPQCGNEMVFWAVAVDRKAGSIREDWNCPYCNSNLSKSPKKNSGGLRVERVMDTLFDRAIGKTIQQGRQVPVLINYSVGKKRFEKKPDIDDLELIQKIDIIDIPNAYPIEPIMLKGERWGDTWRAGVHVGITHVHHFFTKTNLIILANLWEKIHKLSEKRIRLALSLVFTAIIPYASRLRRFRPDKKGGGPLSGTLYIASLITPPNVLASFERNVGFIGNAFAQTEVIKNPSSISTASATQIFGLQNNSIDYIFIDPPFGGNLMYSELNFLWEVWLKSITNTQNEAIINNEQKKSLKEYQSLMEDCFREFFRLLKSGRWMTVEFHNSQNSVWNAIQEGLLRAGFMVADVRTLDKQQGTFKQVTTSSAVKQDLVISAYKPTTEFEQKFLKEGGSEQGAWEFTRQHLEQLPLPILKNQVIEPLSERMPYLLYDRMLAFHIQRGLSVPLSAPDFYQGLSQRFLEREGMVFTPSQAAAYDKLRLQAERVEQLALFVNDEHSARQWLRQELEQEPATYGDLQPRFIQALHQARHEDLPELQVLLEQSFLKDSAGCWYVPDPDNAAHLDELRQRALLGEFHEYAKSKGRLKIFRSEAVRAGFSHAWHEREYNMIVEIAERLPESVLQEDPQLLMYYHNASLRQSGQPKQDKLF